MIYTFTPNPALDIAGTVDRLIANEKNYVSEEIRSAGGNGINAARIIHRLGAKVTAMGFLGGATGTEIRSLLDSERIPHHFIAVSENTRINLSLSNRNSHTQTRLSFPGPSVTRGEWKTFLRFCARMPASSLVVLGGSLPQGVKPKDIASLIQLFRKKNHLCIVDMPGAVLKHLVSSEPLMIKPNLLEFQALVGKRVHSIHEVFHLARRLTRWIPLVCVSSVEDGALLVSKERAWFGKIPDVRVRSTVGAGDSMVGAMSAAIWQSKIQKTDRKNLPAYFDRVGGELLRRGLSAACATLSIPGMTMGDKKTIHRFLGRVNVTEL